MTGTLFGRPIVPTDDLDLAVGEMRLGDWRFPSSIDELRELLEYEGYELIDPPERPDGELWVRCPYGIVKATLR